MFKVPATFTGKAKQSVSFYQELANWKRTIRYKSLIAVGAHVVCLFTLVVELKITYS